MFRLLVLSCFLLLVNATRSYGNTSLVPASSLNSTSESVAKAFKAKNTNHPGSKTFRYLFKSRSSRNFGTFLGFLGLTLFVGGFALALISIILAIFAEAGALVFILIGLKLIRPRVKKYWYRKDLEQGSKKEIKKKYKDFYKLPQYWQNQ